MKTLFPSIKLDKRTIGVLLSVLAALLTMTAPLPGDISLQARKTLAVTLVTVCWWVFEVMSPAYTTLMMLLAYILFGLASPEAVFKIWTLPLMWMIISAFLIAAAVTRSGLAERVSYFFIIRLAGSYRSIIILTYVLGFLLSFLIPHPFPRSLLLMSLVRVICQKASVNKLDSISMGLSVFIASTAASTILLTGDSTLNLAAVGFSGQSVNWLDWAKYMAVPGLVTSLLMMSLHLVVFPQSGPVNIDYKTLLDAQAKLGPISRQELVTLAWVLAALVLWSTDFLHHIDPAWIALGVVVGLSLPWIGEVLEARDISTAVNWPVIFFVMGALAIGTVGKSSGMSEWLADTLLPAQPPANPYGFAALIGGVTILVHMLLGSALSTMSIIAPPMVHYAASSGWSPLVPALLVYTAASTHFILPFQHVSILIGQGETGGYSSRHVLRYGIPLTLVTLFVMIVVEVSWWRFLGLL